MRACWRNPLYRAVVKESSARPLAERIELLREAGIKEVMLANTASEAISRLRRLPPASVLYLVDLNTVTAPLAIMGAAFSDRVVIDIGDDAHALALGMGKSRTSARTRRTIETVALARANGVVFRGRMHPVMRRLGKWNVWCPDTVKDVIASQAVAVDDSHTIATFGSMAPVNQDGWTYGMEVVEAVAIDKSLKGIIVGEGPGLGAIRDIVKASPQLRKRLTIHGYLPQEKLLAAISDARFITSYQSNDVAGWVRTTGKLPLVLASGKILLTTPVGEAVFSLPRGWLIDAKGPREFAQRVPSAVRELSCVANTSSKDLAMPFIRSVVAKRLRQFLVQVTYAPR